MCHLAFDDKEGGFKHSEQGRTVDGVWERYSDETGEGEMVVCGASDLIVVEGGSITSDGDIGSTFLSQKCHDTSTLFWFKFHYVNLTGVAFRYT